jgi:hypothetical protein
MVPDKIIEVKSTYTYELISRMLLKRCVHVFVLAETFENEIIETLIQRMKFFKLFYGLDKS